MTTGTLSSCKMDIRIGYRVALRTVNLRHKQTMSAEVHASIPEAWGVEGDKSKEFIKARQELPWTERTTRTLFTAQEPVASTKELLEGLKMEGQQRWVLPEEWWDCAVEKMIPAERARHNCR